MQRRMLIAIGIILVPLLCMGIWMGWRSSDKGKAKRMARYDWLASNSGPKDLPTEIADGSAFVLRDGSSLYVPPSVVKSGWGEPVSIHVVGARLKALPTQLLIVFYSYMEDKLYHGMFNLPYERIAELFAAGITDYRDHGIEHNPYRKIVAGAAPGGAVAVWVAGLGRTTEVFFGHASELDRDFNLALGLPPHVSRKQWRESELAPLAANKTGFLESSQNLRLGAWDAYHARYLWHMVFEGMRQPKFIPRIHYYNGEYESWPWPLQAQAEAEQHAVPSKMSITVSLEGHEHARNYEIVFDEQEILSTFQRLSKERLVPLELVFISTPKLEIEVRTAAETVRLTRLTYEVHKGARIKNEPAP